MTWFNGLDSKLEWTKKQMLKKIKDEVKANISILEGMKLGLPKPQKVKRKTSKTKKLKPIENKLDDLWSLKVKERAGFKCEYCGKDSGLNSHHIYSRSKKSVRWDLDNGVCLCVAHHTFSSTFSAHKAPAEFIDWIRRRRGSEWTYSLGFKANQVVKVTRESLEELVTKLGIDNG